MVRINYSQDENNKITVSAADKGSNVSLGGSVSFLYNQAKDWAIKMDGLVMNEDYSSKYYASKAKENYEDVLVASEDAIAKLGEVVSAGEIAVSNISQEKNIAVSNILQEKNNSISDIRNSLDESVASIGESLSDSLSSIDLAKENAISDMHSTKDGILSVISSTKDGAVLDVLESKDKATEEIDIELSKGISQITSIGNSVVNDANLLLVSANMEAIKSNVNNIDNININAININSINATATNIDALKNTAGLIDELATKANKSLSNIDDQGKQIIKQYAAEASYDLANSTTMGVMKLFDSTGSATDGTMTQAAITNALSAEVSSLAGIISSKANTSDLTSHTGNKSNPHAVTKAQVGLGNVDNTSDALKPISNATQAALDNKLAVNGTAAKATADASGNNIVNTYLTKTSASSTYAAKATTLSGYGITNAYTKTDIDSYLNNKLDKTGTATKATADASGNNIVNTYRKISDSYTKTEVDNLLKNSSSGSGTGDGKSITKTSDNKLQAIGVLDAGNTSTALKSWTGTRSQYDAIATKDNNTIYHITDDTDITLSLLETLYPVGAIYIGTCASCPLQVLGVGNWALKASDMVLQGSGTRTAKETVEAGLPNITGRFDRSNRNGFGAAEGAFYNGASVGGFARHGDKDSSYVEFDASRSNPIYGNSDTVQPPAYIVNIWERIS